MNDSFCTLTKIVEKNLSNTKREKKREANQENTLNYKEIVLPEAEGG